MILSDEPGYYKTGAYGIRIENLIVVTPAEAIDGGDRPMLGFETITFAPIDRRLIDVGLMTTEEVAWLDAYHAALPASSAICSMPRSGPGWPRRRGRWPEGRQVPAARFASLPWYDLPETRAAQDALWTIVARHLRRQGIDRVPSRLTRGRPVAAMLADPGLLLGQCCGYDIVYGFADCVSVLATPEYDAAGCDGADYRSLVLVRTGSTAATLEDLRGGICVVNGFNSHSGTNALRALVAPLSRDGRFFRAVKVSGGHTASLAMLDAGAADVMAMDCVVHALLARHRPQALAATRILCRTDAAPAPPFVTALAADATIAARTRDALADAVADRDASAPLADLLLRGIAFRPATDYARILAFEAAALARGYMELHATSPALVR